MRDIDPMFTEEEMATWREGRVVRRQWLASDGRQLVVRIERLNLGGLLDRGTLVSVCLLGDDFLVRVEAPNLKLAYQYAFTLVADILYSRFDAPAPGLVDEQEEAALHPCTPFDEVYERSMAYHNYGAHTTPTAGKSWVVRSVWEAAERHRAALEALKKRYPNSAYFHVCRDGVGERHRIEVAAFERGRRSVLGESDDDDE